MVEMTPSVSICIPAFNEPELIKRALSSIFIQTYTDYEIIITDDSTDNRIENLVKNFDMSKIIYIHNTYQLGSPKNWNKTISISSGKYIKILHHDDFFLDENSLKEFVQMLEKNPNSDLAFCTSIDISPTYEQKIVHTPKKYQLKFLKINPIYLFTKNIIGSPSATIFRRTNKVFFDEKLKWVVDIDLYIRLLMSNNCFIFNPKPLIFISFNHPHQVTRDCENNKNVEIPEYIYLFKKIKKLSIFNLSIYAFLCLLFFKYNIKSVNELIQLGVEPPIPREVSFMILFCTFTMPIGMCYRRIRNIKLGKNFYKTKKI